MASEFFNDCLRGLGLQDVACTTLWDDEPGMPRIVLSFFRGLGAQDFQREEHERLNSLGQHLNRAFKIAWKLGKLSREQALQQSVMDGLRQAALVLDGHQKILQANAEGQALLSEPDGLLQIRHGRLVGLGNQVSMSLAETFASADRGIPACIVYRLDRENGQSLTGSARILPLGEARILGLPELHVRYLLLIERAAEPDTDALAAFGQLYQLTRTELAVLAQLLNDATAEDIAATLDIGLPTVRTHLQNLRRKTGVRRQSELVRLALAALRSG
jgi:DNA-binding CsgD family transcriptional regulator